MSDSTKEINSTSEPVTKPMLAPVLTTDRRHSHFWIEDERLFESYWTIRGLRYRYRYDVKGLPDTDKCPDDMLKYIEAEYLS